MDKWAFIICNGPSRKEFELDDLRGCGVSFGSNALYREWESDYLLSIDEDITEEIRQSSYPEDRHIVPHIEYHFEDRAYHGMNQRPRNNCGMLCMKYAIEQMHTELFILGMDTLLLDESYRLGNIFEGTKNYEDDTKASLQDVRNRVKYLMWFMHTKHPSISFIFIFPTIERHKIYGAYEGIVNCMSFSAFKGMLMLKE